MNITIISGNVGSVKPAASFENSKVLNFSVAVDKKYKNKKDELVTETTWFDCSLWNREKVYPFIKVGTRVTIKGEIDARAYIDKDDASKANAVLVLTVDEIDFINKPEADAEK